MAKYVNSSRHKMKIARMARFSVTTRSVYRVPWIRSPQDLNDGAANAIEYAAFVSCENILRLWTVKPSRNMGSARTDGCSGRGNLGSRPSPSAIGSGTPGLHVTANQIGQRGHATNFVNANSDRVGQKRGSRGDLGYCRSSPVRFQYSSS